MFNICDGSAETEHPLQTILDIDFGSPKSIKNTPDAFLFSGKILFSKCVPKIMVPISILKMFSGSQICKKNLQLAHFRELVPGFCGFWLSRQLQESLCGSQDAPKWSQEPSITPKIGPKIVPLPRQLQERLWSSQEAPQVVPGALDHSQDRL